MSARTYTATARREGRWWVITVSDIGATQARALADAPAMAADMIAAMEDVPVADVAVTVTPELPREAREAVAGARSLSADVARKRGMVTVRQREAVQALQAAGVNGRDAAWLLGVSKPRVSKIARSKERQPA